MEQYIPKDALVAEIKRLIDCCCKMCAGDLDFLQKSYPEHYYSIETYREILSFLDTLEVKEVDLDKEIGKYLDTNNIEFSHQIKLFDFAKHFYELGMLVSNKVKKGE